MTAASHCKIWSGGRDLNPQPSPWKSETLPLSYPRPVLPQFAARPQILRRPTCAPNWTAFEHRSCDYPAAFCKPTTSSWWTGKDSNLRSPQGAADLQSAGFSHSPTRPVKTFWERELRVPNLSFNNLQASHAKTQKGLVSKDTSPFVFPVRIRSALAPLQNSWWSWRRELNPRPSDYKSDALPAELRQRRSNRVRIAEEVLELQEVALKYRARGWPALWKIASALDHLDTRYLPYPLYFSIESSQPLRSEFNRRR